MQSNKPSLFHSSTCLSKEQLVLYHQHKLSASDTHTVEHHLVDCELCSEALEGIALLPSMDMLEKVRDDIQKKYPVKEKEIPFYKQNNIWYAAASVALVAVFGWVTNNYVQNNKQEVATLKVQEPTLNAVVTAPVQSDFAANDTQPIKMEAVPPVQREASAKVNMSAQNTIRQQAPMETAAGSAMSEMEVSRNADEVVIADSKMAEEKFSDPVAPSTPVSADVNADLAKSKVLKDKDSEADLAVINLAGYKVYNYNYSPAPSAEKNAVGNAGVPAKYESREDMSKKAAYNSINVKEVSYDNFLAGALNDYKTKKYSSAINKFQLILHDYPNDINALFYSALSFEETKEYFKALSYLDKLDALPNKTFDQESQWHRALVLLQKGDVVAAKNLLKTIAEKKGFYAAEAEKKLKESQLK